MKQQSVLLVQETVLQLGLHLLHLLVSWAPGGQGVLGDQMKPARAPLIPHRPFLVVWNAPTESCRLRFEVDLDLSVFDIVANLNETLSGTNVTIFYHSHLGLYPYYSSSGEPVHGGLPQNQSLPKHLSKARDDIDKLIPHKDFRGLGVIDWENWRPQWVRNWGTKDIYRNRSKEHVRKLHPTWPDGKVETEAKESFERSGVAFMNSTLAVAEGRRPAGLWGFYLYPDCYNYGYKRHPQRYTGECPDVEHLRNDHLMWLWRESTALYPSVYLDYELRSSANTVKFVHHRVKEAMRIASIARTDHTLPVFVYSRPFYAYTFVVLSERDLVSTIGESAALGASGVVLWGSSEYASSQRNCLAVKKYIDGPLGHYVVNVTSAAKLCSKALCQKNGRCVRKSLASGALLHLDKRSFHIQRRGAAPRGRATGPRHGAAPQGHATTLRHGAAPRGRATRPRHGAAPRGRATRPRHGATPRGRATRPRHGATPRGHDTRQRYRVSGRLRQQDLLDMKHRFSCQCYQGWTGVHCEMPQAPPPSHAPLPRPRDGGLLEYALFLLSFHSSCLIIITFLGFSLLIKYLTL